MVKVVLTNNGTAVEKIVDESQAVAAILSEADFAYSNATLNIQGRAVSPDLLGEPLASFIDAGATTVRITAVAHKSNAA